MSDIAIRVDGLSKLYKIGALRSKHDTLRDRINDVLFNPFKKLAKVAKAQRNPIIRSTSSSSDDHIWALKDVSFEVKRGEVIGIIGRNGAGKTTLLKILSRITEPTEGRVEIYGRVGSLLEVGTGFHPELTGRENIYLNGAILGMKKSDIERKFDEIVAFAEIEKFLDTPVKRYSSGMYVRLAFAVAAHLDPEILLVDEVLAVGDAAFQKKCLGKMGDVAKEGRTVLFVSHNMTAVRSLCPRSILIETGRIRLDSKTAECIDLYLAGTFQDESTYRDTSSMPRPDNISPNSGLRITNVRLCTHNGLTVVKTGESLSVTMEFVCIEMLQNVGWGFYVETLDGLRLLDLKSVSSFPPFPSLAPGEYSITGSLPTNPLMPGRYKLGVGARDEARGLDWLPEVMQFTVEESQRYDSLWFEKTAGIFRVKSLWQPPVKIRTINLP
jgi:lipopolysaccharide transport system ATP-binding protein